MKMKRKHSIEKTPKPLIKCKNNSLSESVPDSIATKTSKKKKFAMPSKVISEDVINSCVNAILQLSIQNKKDKKLLEDEIPIFAEINCIKIQSSKTNIRFILPHTTYPSTNEVCLVTPDLKKGKKPDHEPTVEHWEEILQKAGVSEIKTILPMRQLRVEYDQFELKRRLLTLHDFIMVDTRVLNHVSKILGKTFFKKHNMLVPVRISGKNDIKKAINVGLHTSILRMNEGRTSTILVGHTGMSQQHLKENVAALVTQLKKKYPGGEANIRTISLKLPLSLAVPLYITLRPSHTVNAPKVKHPKPNNFVEVEDELSTIPGATVRVAPDGTVHVKRSRQQKKTELSDESESNDEGLEEKSGESEID